MKLITIIGARPQFIKASTLSRILKENHEEIIVHTGQHYDENMSDVFFDELEIPRPKYNLGVGSCSHAEQTGKILIEVEKILIKERPQFILLYGDTNSTLAGALAGSKLHIPIVHIEGGVRTGLLEMPEEVNRILTDNVSELIFSPTQDGIERLREENLVNRSFCVGDIMLDATLFAEAKVENNLEILKKFNIEKENYYVATIHRPKNTDSQKRLSEILEALNEFDSKVLMVTHPRTKVKMKDFDISPKNFENIKFVDSLGYFDMLNVVKNSISVITDSGGLQKEACFLGKQCINIYETTGWKELEELGWIYVVGKVTKENIIKGLSDRKVEGDPQEIFGGGKAAEKTVKIIENYFKEKKSEENISISPTL